MGKIVRHEIDLDNPPPRTDEQKARLKALAEMPDSEIDYSDIPPLDDAFWGRTSSRVTSCHLSIGVAKQVFCDMPATVLCTTQRRQGAAGNPQGY